MPRQETQHDSRCQPGLYRIDTAQRASLLAGQRMPSSMRLLTIDGEKAVGRDTFFTEIADRLSFPDYFGSNWDAFYDCLTDLKGSPDVATVILFDRFGTLTTNE